MAKIVEDHGLQRRMTAAGRVKYSYMFLLDCGCELEIEQQNVLSLRGVHGFEWLVSSVADVHFCPDKLVGLGAVLPPLGVVLPVKVIQEPEKPKDRFELIELD